MVDEFNAERVGEQELEGGWWDSKHRLEFILSKQKWKMVSGKEIRGPGEDSWGIGDLCGRPKPVGSIG